MRLGTSTGVSNFHSLMTAFCLYSAEELMDCILPSMLNGNAEFLYASILNSSTMKEALQGQ